MYRSKSVLEAATREATSMSAANGSTEGLIVVITAPQRSVVEELAGVFDGV
jgi:hypothetical protein